MLNINKDHNNLSTCSEYLALKDMSLKEEE